MLTLREALTRATDQLSAHPDLRPTALPDAVQLLLHTLAIDRATLIAHPERPLDAEAQRLYQQALTRRLAFEPIQYITGTQEFYGLPFRVTPAVLIPRPETEHLVEAVQTRVPPKASILDVGTGSGAIAIALAHLLPAASLTAVDLSPEALAVARQNAQTNSVTIHFQQSDLLASLPPDQLFDAIVSNPPYIPESEPLHPQVRAHEPHTALFAGPDGLALYRRLIPQALEHLKPNGLLALEIGHNQSAQIRDLLATWHQVEFLPDLQQIPRVALARRP